MIYENLESSKSFHCRIESFILLQLFMIEFFFRLYRLDLINGTSCILVKMSPFIYF